MNVHPSRCALVAGLALAAALAWQLVVVYAGHGGNWTGLFWFGSAFPAPPALADQHLVVREGTSGYDGQFYYYMAQDPFLQKGYAASMDVPRFRYRRILMPLAAHVLALGQPGAIAPVFALLVALSVALGVYVLARFAQSCGRSPALGLAFLATPVALISLDRQVVDAALAACCIAAALCVRENRPRSLWLVLAAAMLIRETGLLLIAAACASEVLNRRHARALIFATAALPALAWYAFVHAHTPGYSEPLFDPVPLRVWFASFVSPSAYESFGALAWLPRALDRIGLLAVPLSIALALAAFARRPREFTALAGALFAALALWHSAPGTWIDSYGYARSFAPLFILPALDGLARGAWTPSIAVALPLPRVALQIAGQLATLFRSA